MRPKLCVPTTCRLEQLGYAQTIDWVCLIDPAELLNIVPNQGDAINLLVRYLSLQ